MAGSEAEATLVLLSGIRPTALRGELAEMTVGESDALLLDLFEETFGGKIRGVLRCPSCQAEIELEFEASRLRVPPAASPRGTFLLHHEGWEIAYRVPTSSDLALLGSGGDPWRNGGDEIERGRLALLKLCVVEVHEQQAPREVEDIPPSVATALAEEMARRDPQADNLVSVACPVCRSESEAILNIAAYVRAELHRHAARLLREVHSLARGYGWGEKEILGLSQARRNAYLEMLAE